MQLPSRSDIHVYDYLVRYSLEIIRERAGIPPMIGRRKGLPCVITAGIYLSRNTAFCPVRCSRERVNSSCGSSAPRYFPDASNCGCLRGMNYVWLIHQLSRLDLTVLHSRGFILLVRRKSRGRFHFCWNARSVTSRIVRIARDVADK